MKKTNLYLILIASSFLVQNVYAMEESDWKEKEEGSGINKYKKKEKERSKDRFESYVDEEEIADDNIDELLYTVRLAGPIKLVGGGYAKGCFELISKDGENVIPYTPKSLKVEVTGFEPQNLPDISTLNPLVALPTNINFGSSHKKIRYSFQYDGHEYEDEVVDTFSSAYPHQAKWKEYEVTIEDQEQHKSRFALQLKVRLENKSFHKALDIPKTLDHSPGKLGPQLPGKLYYDGKITSLRRYRQKEWIVPNIPGQALHTYEWPLMSVEEVVPTHKKSKVVFVEVVPISGEKLATPDREYKGDYDNPAGTLPLISRKGKLTSKYLIYSDGADIFLPKVTHELWERNGWRVGFGIASYNDKGKTHFISAVPNNTVLPKGIYYLDSIPETHNKRTEIWKRLGDDPLEFKIDTPLGVSSIPGMGCVYLPSRS